LARRGHNEDPSSSVDISREPNFVMEVIPSPTIGSVVAALHSITLEYLAGSPPRGIRADVQDHGIPGGEPLMFAS
jgi:hypothetical protein